MFIDEKGLVAEGLCISNGELIFTPIKIELEYKSVLKACKEIVDNEEVLVIHYEKSLLSGNSKQQMAVPGLKEIDKWLEIISSVIEQDKKNRWEIEEKTRRKEEEEALIAANCEMEAQKFYDDCMAFHIQADTPKYYLSEANKIASLIYVGNDKSLNFLQIDGYSKVELIGKIPYSDIHYYEIAGNVHYTSTVNGNVVTPETHITGGSISPTAVITGGLLFGVLGMAAGAALSHQPMEVHQGNSVVNLNSSIEKIDDRNVLLNYYSQQKNQYIDIELPREIYNFLQTFLPEKKYSIVEEIERKTALNQSQNLITEEKDKPLITGNGTPSSIESTTESSMDTFKKRLEKLKMMKEMDLLTEEEFNEFKMRLINEI